MTISLYNRLMEDQIKKISDWLGTGSINIFGMPFSGKDTQGQILADLLGGALIGGGDILRAQQNAKIDKILAKGDISPTDYYLKLIPPYFSKSEYNNQPLILSSVGRSHGEEPAIMKAAADSGHPIKAVIMLSLSEAEVWKRFKAVQIQQDRGRRADDKQESLETRLKRFQEKTMPVIKFYRNTGLLVEVDGALSRKEVTSEILKSLASRT